MRPDIARGTGLGAIALRKTRSLQTEKEESCHDHVEKTH